MQNIIRDHQWPAVLYALVREEKRDVLMMNEPTTTEMTAWPEDARRYVKALKEALEACRAERGHYAAIVHEHEQAWGYEEPLRDQVEGLGIRNAELKIECQKLRAERRAMSTNR